MTEKLGEQMRRALQKAYLAGFMASGEGWNGEYPFNDYAFAGSPEDDAGWIKCRDEDLARVGATDPLAIREAALLEAADLIDKRHRGDLPDHILSDDGNAIRALIDGKTAG